MSATDVALHLLFAMAAIVGLAQIVGRACSLVGQPRVIGEMVAGIMLGPSLLGRLAPGAESFLLPRDVVVHLRTLAGVGVVLFMFLVGTELDVERFRARARSAVVVSVVGIAAPLLLALPLARALYPLLAPPGVSPLVFAAFFAVAMSITAFPVLARIIAERGLERKELGILALTCAAVNDVCAWCLLAVVVGLAASSAGRGFVTIAWMLLYVAGMLLVARPLLWRLARSQPDRATPSLSILCAVFALLLVSATITDFIGIHSLFGAFLTGALIPANGKLGRAVHRRLERPVAVILLPVFFAFAGLRTELGLLRGPREWSISALILAVAFLGKLGGTSFAARVTGASVRRSLALGALMNTRGLMELVVLNVGLDLGIISRSLFAMMVIMALVTTIAAGPLLNWIGQEE